MTDTLGRSQPGGRSGDRMVLDSSVLRAADRFDAWTQAVSHSFVPLVADPKARNGALEFQGRLVSQTLGQAEINTVSGSAMSVHRSERSIARDNPGYIKIGLQLRGYSVVSQDERDAALAPGDFAIYDTTRPYRLDFDSAFAMFVVMVPAELLRIDRRTLSTLTASRFSGRRGLGAVTSAMLRELSRQLDEQPLASGHHVSDAVLDLVTATVSERLEPIEGLPDASRRRVLRLQAENYIIHRLSDPTLTVTAIASAHNVSVRYLQKLFEQHQTTVSGWIRSRRLEQCRRDLGAAGLGDRPVSSIGASWGFTDAAAFARAFRLEFGVSPTQYRHEMLARGSTVPLMDGTSPIAQSGGLDYSSGSF
ncbi:helix-turn-helix domain-containing protein [Cryobacterium sp. PH29-G1]|uniref:AraC-like ligand-binding domain-containing protein n=1 Tax=Cryobacterium sp. PH29-G1 TaxID=3046211 RepID=UPI0024BB9B08|nr:helix-turn-helix domain-containing protein [Cryobacterium sp. PH29-G1]MDJ0347886.1 helix-turn-helix domain-containing protein [Cryobacterium sp. PH29-G1]